jgi:hypothetical protein
MALEMSRILKTMLTGSMMDCDGELKLEKKVERYVIEALYMLGILTHEFR